MVGTKRDVRIQVSNELDLAGLQKGLDPLKSIIKCVDFSRKVPVRAAGTLNQLYPWVMPGISCSDFCGPIS